MLSWFRFRSLISQIAKRRPALVLVRLRGDDVILCQITSKSIDDEYAIALLDDDFETGSLNQASNIRPNRIFTADRNIILKTVGKIRSAKINETIERIVSVLKNES